MSRDAAQAVSYAQSIGLDSVYEEAQQALTEWNKAEHTAIAARHVLRQLEEQLADRELEVASLERAANPDMSATAFEKHMKAASRGDAQCREIREGISNARWELDCAVLTSDEAKHTLRIKSARLNELGGYFSYLAAVRVASLQTGQSGQSHEIGSQAP